MTGSAPRGEIYLSWTERSPLRQLWNIRAQIYRWTAALLMNALLSITTAWLLILDSCYFLNEPWQGCWVVLYALTEWQGIWSCDRTFDKQTREIGADSSGGCQCWRLFSLLAHTLNSWHLLLFFLPGKKDLTSTDIECEGMCMHWKVIQSVDGVNEFA